MRGSWWGLGQGFQTPTPIQNSNFFKLHYKNYQMYASDPPRKLNRRRHTPHPPLEYFFLDPHMLPLPGKIFHRTPGKSFQDLRTYL